MAGRKRTRAANRAPPPATGVARSTAKRNEILEQLADQVLANGLGTASLRPLAASIGTSDRMLLYYFPDKATLISSILQCVAQRLAALLDEEVPADRALTPDEMSRTLWASLRKPALRPYMRLWLELAGYAARAEEPHRTIGAAIAQGFLDWIAARLADCAHDAAVTASSVLIQIEGRLLLDAFGITVEPARRASR